MASGSNIVVTSLYGRKEEGIISGAHKPGTLMQIKVGTAPVGGRYTYEPYAPGLDGTPAPVIVLDIDSFQGKTADDAYVSGDRCMLWHPVRGDELNVRKADIPGTGTATEDLSVGEKLLIVSGTGFVSPVVVGVGAAQIHYPFTALEAITDQAAETLVHVQFSD